MATPKEIVDKKIQSARAMILSELSLRMPGITLTAEDGAAIDSVLNRHRPALLAAESQRQAAAAANATLP